MSQDKSLESRVRRDKLTEIGLLAGGILGCIYWSLTKDNSLMELVAKTGLSGAGFAYCVGSVVYGKEIYLNTKE